MLELYDSMSERRQGEDYLRQRRSECYNRRIWRSSHGNVRFRANPRCGSTVPKPSQAQLVSALLQGECSAHTLAFEPLTGLSKQSCAPGYLCVSASTRQRLKQLPAFKTGEKKLTRALQEELDALLAESDRIALVKAKANYTLSLLKA